MNPPALRDAAADPDIQGAPLAVYVYLCDELDPREFRPVKVASVASALHMKDVTAAWALTRLGARGYLQRGRRQGRLRTYRLVWSLRHTRPVLEQSPVVAL